MRVKYVDDRTLKDYAGANYYFAKAVGFPYPYPENVILIDKKLSSEKRAKTIIHEVVERNLMRQGENYWSAHQIALEMEKDVD